jgi:hypothetical protein
MARSRKNGRFAKTTRRRRSKPKTNLSNVAQSFIIANAISQGATKNGLVEFFTSTHGGHSYELTARELLNFAMGGTGGIYGPTAAGSGIDATPQAVMLHNIKQNWPMMVGTAILVPVGFNVAKKLLRKPVILPANRMLKSVGLDVKL